MENKRENFWNKKIFIIIFAVITILALWFFIRFVIGGPEDNWISVKLYYYNPDLDKDESGNIACSKKGLVLVERNIPLTKTSIQDTIKLLISGQLTEEEKSQGITTEYPLEGFSLKNASLKDKILTLEFKDPNYKTGGGSCRVGILWFQIEQTAKQFSGVKKVQFLPEDLFQP